MPGWIAAALFLLDLTIKIVALGLVPKNRRPSSGMAWLLLIYIIPFVGFVVFLIMGRTRLGQRRHEQQAEVNAIIAERTTDISTVEAAFTGPGTSRRWRPSTATSAPCPCCPGNKIDLFPGYDDRSRR